MLGLLQTLATASAAIGTSLAGAALLVSKFEARVETDSGTVEGSSCLEDILDFLDDID
jgi:hypothetical protein